MKASLFFLLLFPALLLAQGPYSPQVGKTGSKAINKEDTRFSQWAQEVSLTRGFQNIANTAAGLASIGTAMNAVGFSGQNGVVSLGDGGEAILTFNEPIRNLVGPDFAVFENGFDDYFLELAFVEVSSDGINYVRFPAVSLTDTAVQKASFDSLEATELYNFAGKFRGGWGTPFDLEELKDEEGLDVNAITHVKIIDVVGSINANYATYDAEGRKVNDPWPTEFVSSGFDLDAVGVLNNLSTGLSGSEADAWKMHVYPNPSSDLININLQGLRSVVSVVIHNQLGKVVFTKETANEKLSIHKTEHQLGKGVYFITVRSGNRIETKQLMIL